MSDLAVRRRKAEEQAYGLGIALYLREEGPPQQHPPGERIEPAKGAVPLGHGHGRGAEAKAQP